MGLTISPSGGGIPTPITSAGLASAITDESGTGKAIFAAGTLVIPTGKTATISNTLTFSGTDASTLNIGTGGTLGTNAYTSGTSWGTITGTLSGQADLQSALDEKTGVAISLTPGTVPVASSGNNLADSSITDDGFGTVSINSNVFVSSLMTDGFVKSRASDGKLTVDSSSYAPLVGTTSANNATAGNVGEYISSSVVQGSAVSLVTATPKTVTSIVLTAGDWDVTAIGCLNGASTGTEFDVAIGATTNSLTGTVLGDSRCQSPTVSLTGADASLMVPEFRVNISGSATYYLIVQETFTVGSPKAYGRISARRVR